MTKIPGLPVKHAIILPTCRRNRTAMGAFEEAVDRLRAEYRQLLPYWENTAANFHVVLTLEKEPRS